MPTTTTTTAKSQLKKIYSRKDKKKQCGFDEMQSSHSNESFRIQTFGWSEGKSTSRSKKKKEKSNERNEK